MEKVEGTGSVWNTGNYHWEEKSVGKWSEERLKEILGSFKFALPGGELKATEVKKLKGEASVSIRKGKKIITYEYAINLKWEMIIKDGDGNELGKMKGDFDLPEVSNDLDDDGEDYEVKTNVTEDSAKLKARFFETLRKDGAKALRTAIKEGFVKELKLK